MPIMCEISGDVFIPFKQGKYDAFVHGCNCFHTMGAGVAAAVMRNYPDAYKADKATKYGDRDKLGTYSYCDDEGGKIINLYTQYDYGGGKVNLDYSALERGFTLLNEDLKGQFICTVRIGAGLAGGDWPIIVETINRVTPDLNIDVYTI